MDTEPLVTVVTSSWLRPNTLINNAVASIKRQTYEHIEHLVIIDGYDEDTEGILTADGYHPWSVHLEDKVLNQKRFISLGKNWSKVAKDKIGSEGFGATARLTGSLLAAGELVTYLDDDNVYLSRHIEEMVKLFTSDPEVEFALSAWNGQQRFPAPNVGACDTSGIMHRDYLLLEGGFDPRDGYEGDGHMARKWAEGGHKWAAKDSPTFTINGYHRGAPLG